MRVAAINWRIRDIRRRDGFFEHLAELVEQAAAQGAELAVLPELAVLELLGLDPELPPEDVPTFLAAFAEEFELEAGKLAARHGLTLCAGSHFRRERDVLNVSITAFPDGMTRYQPKVKLTSYERDVWKLGRGQHLEPANPPLGVTICYDCEFPESGRKLAESGVLIQCVPAFTETKRGFQRVRWSCHARAIENQIYVVHSSLVGSLGREPAPQSFGSSAILAPCIEPFPESAVLAETARGEEGIAIADLDLQMLLLAREQGDVRNWNDRAPEW
ncbi:MAG: nitrilase-related carbon-nitrogen hydrolase [Fimbriimonadaceae bacterium]